MKTKIKFLFIVVLFIFVFLIFYKGLEKPSLYEPKSEDKNIPKFFATTFFEKEKIKSNELFKKNNYYLFNIWASWCVPCRDEHPYLIELSQINQLTIIGLNYKDNYENAVKFLNELGNPYEKILIDRDGVKAIEWGAFGVPETFLIYNNKIIKRFIGPLDIKKVEQIKKKLQ
mgnify:FL=1